MTRITDEARAAGLAALHADSEWHRSDGTGVWRANYRSAVDLVLTAALPHLEGATPAIDRRKIEEIIATEAMAYDSLDDLLAVDDGEPDTLRRATDAILALLGGAS